MMPFGDWFPFILFILFLSLSLSHTHILCLSLLSIPLAWSSYLYHGLNTFSGPRVLLDDCFYIGCFHPYFTQIDYESYDWTRLDPTSSDTQAIVNEFLLHEEDVMAYKPHKSEVYDKYKGLTLYTANVFK